MAVGVASASMTRVLFAIDNPAETELFRAVVSERKLDMQVAVPSSVADADSLISAGEIDIIITDLAFQNGGFAEWLFLWQHPFILLAEWSEYDRVGSIVSDQTSSFAVRDAQLQHIRYLPLIIRKVLGNKESMDRHNLSLRLTEERYRELVQALPDIIYSLDGAGRFTYINDSVRRLGWEPVELIGKHFGTILDPAEVDRVSRDQVLKQYLGTETGAENAPKLFDERRTGERRTRDLLVRLRPRDESPETADLFGSVIAYGEVNAVGFAPDGPEGHDAGSVGIIRDVSERRNAEQIVRRSLEEKERLLSEIHHRVKNNLQVISSLLNLQAGSVADPAALQHFTDAQVQIHSMALVHEHLYQSGTSGHVDVAPYVEELCTYLYEIFGVSSDRIGLRIKVESIPVDMQKAMPMALILNELVTNSLKYAFPEESSGSITVGIHMVEQGLVELTVEDDGIGLPEDFDITNSRSLGHTLIHGLCSQLDARAEVDGSAGTRFAMRFHLD